MVVLSEFAGTFTLPSSLSQQCWAKSAAWFHLETSNGPEEDGKVFSTL